MGTLGRVGSWWAGRPSTDPVAAYFLFTGIRYLGRPAALPPAAPYWRGPRGVRRAIVAVRVLLARSLLSSIRSRGARGASAAGEGMAVAFDEMTETDGQIRPVYAGLQGWLRELPPDVLEHRRREADVLF